MNRDRIRSASTVFFITAALLAFFGAASMSESSVHGWLQIVLAVLMGGAGAFLRRGTDEARLVGLIAAGLTVAAGGYAFVAQNDYLAGTAVAIFALIRLWSAGRQTTPASQQPPRNDRPVRRTDDPA